MPPKITVFFRSRTFTLKSATLTNLEQDRDCSQNSADLLIIRLHRTALERLALQQKGQVSLIVNDSRKITDSERYEILSLQRSTFAWEESKNEWKNRKLKSLRIRNWRKR